MKKFIILILCAIEIILFSYFTYSMFHPGTVQTIKVYKTDSLVTIGNITNEKIEQEFISNLDILDGISVTYANFTNEITEGILDVEIYDYDDTLIYNNEYELSEINDNQTLKFEFKVIKNAKNKKFKAIFDFKDMNKKEYVTLYGQDVKSAKNLFRINDEDYVVRIAQYGQEKNNLYGIISLSMFFILLLIILFNIFNKKVNIMFSGYKLFIQSVVLLFISIFTAYTLLNVMIANYHFGQVAFMLLLIFIIGMSILITNLALVLASKEFKLQNLFLALAIPVGAFYMLLVIPSSVPDEPFHYSMAYQISVGNFDMKNNTVPNEGGQEYYTYLKYKYHLNGVIKDLQNDVKNPYNPIYSPLLYLFSGFGIFIGNLFKVSIMATKLFGRLSNFIFFLFVGYYIIKKISFGKLLMFVYLLNPMNMQQVASLSCDCVINCSSLLFITLMINLINEKEKIDIKTSFILAISMVLVLLSKNAYFPLLFMLPLIWKNIKSSSKKEKIFFGIMLLLVFVIFKLCNYKSVTVALKAAKNLEYVQPKYTKLGYLLTVKYNIIYIIYNTIKTQGPFYLLSFVGGSLGKININIPVTISVMYIITLCISLFGDDNDSKLTTKNKLYMLLIYLINVAIVFAGLYIGWGASRTLVVEGVQGRYFIPITILPLLILINKNNKIGIKNKEYVITLMLVFIHLVSLYHVVCFFLS